jgi:hypothetical protein
MPTDSGWTPSVPEAVHVTRRNQESTAAGIYGVIVSSAVMSASHADSAGKVIGAVLVTLMVYWGAERYARIVAERTPRGPRRRQPGELRPPGRATVAARGEPARR